MRLALETTPREFLRVASSLSVRYQFVTHTAEADSRLQVVHEGTTQDLSGGGLCLVGAPLPDDDWASALLTQRLEIALSIRLPDETLAYAVGRVVWLEADTASTQFGIAFTRITKATQHRLFDLALEGTGTELA
ncbi:MAG: PilZ domain-containing protein [Planctomycetota bacterium]